MKNYLTGTDSLLDNPIINPSWPANERPLSDIQYIIVHHEAQDRPHDYTNTPRYEAEATYQNNSSIPGSQGIQYHAHIDNQGTITFLRPLTTYLWHCGNLDVNKKSIAVCVDGNLTTQQPTREQFEALKELLDYWSTPASGAFPADQGDVYGHRQFSATNCPGDNMIGFVNDYRTTRGNPTIPDVPYDWPEYQPVVGDKPIDSITPPASTPVIPVSSPEPVTSVPASDVGVSSDNDKEAPVVEGAKSSMRLAILGGVSYVIGLGLNYLTGLPTSETTVILTLVLKGIDKYVHENPNINLKGLIPF